jgi:hypothetical protein
MRRERQRRDRRRRDRQVRDVEITPRASRDAGPRAH